MKKNKKLKKASGKTTETKNTLTGLSFILPNYIGFAVFVLVPIVFSLLLAFVKWDGFNTMEFVGLDNFRHIFHDRTFRASMSQTFIFCIFTVIFTEIASLGLAVLLNQKMRGTTFFRSAIFFPFVASIVAVGAVWKAMFMKVGGPVNVMLSHLGVAEENLPGWFSSTKWAMFGVILVTIWKNMGYYMVIYLAALQNIPSTLYEAASMDGANAWDRFCKITLPMLTPTHFFVIIMLTINSFKVFDLIFNLTEGGPGTASNVLSMYIYSQSFQYQHYGPACAAALILLLIVGGITVIQFRAQKKFENFM